jgi:hypothetical protein
MFSTVTNLIIALNNIELAAFNYDTEVKPLVGTGILVHSVWYCKQTLAQWMVTQNSGYLDPQCALLRSDEYLFPKLLLALPAVGHPPLHCADQSVLHHPARVPILLALSVIGYGNKWFIPVALLCTHLALSWMRKYSFVPPRQLSFHLRMANRCLLFLFAVQMVFPRTMSFVLTLLLAVGMYGYNVILERRFDDGFQSFHPRFRFYAYWLGRNPNFSLSIYNTCVVCASTLLMQLRTTIIYFLYEHAIHTLIDPYGSHYVRGLYTGSEGSAVSVKM